MKDVIREFLFTKGILVEYESGSKTEQFQTLFGLANQLNVNIVDGKELACLEHLKFAGQEFGIYVPKPFYVGFPESVRELSPEALLFDQLVHYFVTYGFDNFNQAGHSLFDSNFERAAFKEETEHKKFIIIKKEDAIKKCKEYFSDLLLSTRPLSETQYAFVEACVQEFKFHVEECACKDTAIKLLINVNDLQFCDFLRLNDVIRLVEQINFDYYHNTNVRKLNLKNVHRKLITKILDYMIENSYYDWDDCFEKRAIWCGLLHHIHYNPKNAIAKRFVDDIRSGEYRSVYSDFEEYMSEGKVLEATECLHENKGEGAVLRNLNYILSRCKNKDDINEILSHCVSDNKIIIIQMMLSYANYKYDAPRNFKFTKFNMLKTHTEDETEIKKRKSVLSKKVVKQVEEFMFKNLKNSLKDKMEKVYVNPQMKNVALPLQENTSMGGYGVLSKGSKFTIPTNKKIRAFTYWEKVNDVDLSVMGLCENGETQEFSWRTMYYNQSTEITFSGDQTSGYEGGSEYFDIDVQEFKEKHPNVRYLVFCNNVYSNLNFSEFICRAGFMVREKNDSGEVFEPKTVKSSFTINCESTESYMFALDLNKGEFIWLNIAKDGSNNVAGTGNHMFLLDYMNVTDVINVYDFFTMMAKTIVSNPEEADVVVSDGEEKLKEGAIKINSYDFEKMLKYLNE